MKVVYDYKAGAFGEALAVTQSILARASTKTINEMGVIAKATARATVAAAGFSGRFQSAIQVRYYPDRKDSIDATALLHSKILYDHVFQSGATIQPKHRQFLWLPLPNVPLGSSGRKLTPRQYIDRLGPLQFVNRGAHPLLLGRATTKTVTRATDRAVRVKKRAVKAGKILGAKVPLFFGKTSVTIQKKFDVPGAVGFVVASRLNDIYQKNLAE